MLKRVVTLFVIVSFILSYCQPVYAQYAWSTGGDFSVNGLPVPGKMVEVSVPFASLALKGLVINPKKPLEFQFIVDTGRGPQDAPFIKKETSRLVKYFLAGITIPEGDLWVNLSPYEKDRIVPNALGQTLLGRDLLAQDYILKQLTASLIYPEKDLGKEFWSRVYKKAQEQFGTTNIPVNTFNKVWILPDQAQVFENGAAAYVTKATLKVMLDEDYLAMAKNECRGDACHRPNIGRTQGSPLQNDTHTLASQIIREIVLPEIEHEVNYGKNFAPLRQIYDALILAKWYKETIQNRLLDAVYTNKKKIAGVDLKDPAVKEEIYNRYLQAYKKGVFNYIKEDATPDGQAVPRKYFSGGTEMMMHLGHTRSAAMIGRPEGELLTVKMDLESAAMTNQTQPAMVLAEEEIMRDVQRGNITRGKLSSAIKIKYSREYNLHGVATTGGSGLTEFDPKTDTLIANGRKIAVYQWDDFLSVHDSTLHIFEYEDYAKLRHLIYVLIYDNSLTPEQFLEMPQKEADLTADQDVEDLTDMIYRKPIFLNEGDRSTIPRRLGGWLENRRKEKKQIIQFPGLTGRGIDDYLSKLDARKVNIWDGVTARPVEINEQSPTLSDRYAFATAIEYRDGSYNFIVYNARSSKTIRWVDSDMSIFRGKDPRAEKVYNFLNRYNFKTVGALIEKNADELLHYPNFGEGLLDYIRTVLQRYRLYLRGERPIIRGDVVNAGIINFGLTRMADRHSLFLAHLYTVGDVMGKTETELRRIGVGSKSIGVIRAFLRRHGLAGLKGDGAMMGLDSLTPVQRDAWERFYHLAALKGETFAEFFRSRTIMGPDKVGITPFLAGIRLMDLFPDAFAYHRPRKSGPPYAFELHISGNIASKKKQGEYFTYPTAMVLKSRNVLFYVKDRNNIESILNSTEDNEVLVTYGVQLNNRELFGHEVNVRLVRGEKGNWGLAPDYRSILSDYVRNDMLIEASVGSSRAMKAEGEKQIIVPILSDLGLSKEAQRFSEMDDIGTIKEAIARLAMNKYGSLTPRQVSGVQGLLERLDDVPNLAMKGNLLNGGIDLNQINIKRTGKIINIPFDPAQLSRLIQGGFKGFAPVITDFQYIKSPFPLLGVKA